MQSMHLRGSEDVLRAASSMRNAAEEMTRAAANIEGSLERFRMWADEALMRLERATEGESDA